MRTILWAILTMIAAPLLLAVAALRRPNPRRFLIVQLAKLGDVACTTAVFRAIKEAHPDAEIHFVCRKRCAEVVLGNPFLAHVHVYDPHARFALIRKLFPLRIVASVNCMPAAMCSVLGLWAAAPLRINTPSSTRGFLLSLFRIFNTVNIPYRIHTRTFDHYMRLLHPLGVPPIPYRIDFFPSLVARSQATSWLSAENLERSPYIIINVTAGNPMKEWPIENFVRLCDHATDNLHVDVVLSTLNRTVVESIRSTVRNPERVKDGSGLALGELAVICERAAAFVSVDTGPMYIAYAVGSPLVIIVGPVDPREQIPPEGQSIAHVLPPAGCDPWVFVSETPRKGTASQLRCTRDTPVEGVIAALERVIRR